MLAFCTECFCYWSLGSPLGAETKKRNAYGIFVCNGFSFIGMVLGDWHKGRGAWGRGVFWKTKAGSHSQQKIEGGGREGGYERVFICLSG